MTLTNTGTHHVNRNGRIIIVRRSVRAGRLVHVAEGEQAITPHWIDCLGGRRADGCAGGPQLREVRGEFALHHRDPLGLTAGEVGSL